MFISNLDTLYLLLHSTRTVMLDYPSSVVGERSLVLYALAAPSRSMSYLATCLTGALLNTLSLTLFFAIEDPVDLLARHARASTVQIFESCLLITKAQIFLHSPTGTRGS